MSTNYEYVVWDNIDNCVHRGPWTEDECLDFFEYAREAFPPGAKIDKLWSIRRRPVGEWSPW